MARAGVYQADYDRRVAEEKRTEIGSMKNETKLNARQAEALRVLITQDPKFYEVDGRYIRTGQNTITLESLRTRGLIRASIGRYGVCSDLAVTPAGVAFYENRVKLGCIEIARLEAEEKGMTQQVFVPDRLSERRIEERALIIHGIDAEECEVCHKAIPEGAAADPAWYIDATPSGDEHDEYVGTIRCPECW